MLIIFLVSRYHYYLYTFTRIIIIYISPNLLDSSCNDHYRYQYKNNDIFQSLIINFILHFPIHLPPLLITIYIFFPLFLPPKHPPCLTHSPSSPALLPLRLSPPFIICVPLSLFAFLVLFAECGPSEVEGNYA